MSLFSVMSNDIGIDLGTASILVYIRGKGVVLKEPSVVAIDRDSNNVVAYGENARLMLGKTPGNLKAVRPLKQGVISDYTLTEKMLKLHEISANLGHIAKYNFHRTSLLFIQSASHPKYKQYYLLHYNIHAESD